VKYLHLRLSKYSGVYYLTVNWTSNPTGGGIGTAWWLSQAVPFDCQSFASLNLPNRERGFYPVCNDTETTCLVTAL
jgi:hypothetical protein